MSLSIDPNTANLMDKLILNNADEYGILEPVTERLLSYMASLNYIPPDDWKGHKFFVE